MMSDTSGYSIRAARPEDIDVLIAFTLDEAREAEGIALNPDIVRRGIAAAFADPPRATCWVAEADDRRVVANASIVTEWSNFRAGEYWWLQSLFIVPEHRGRGLLELLLTYVRGAAAAAGALDFRLYAHGGNERALRGYRRCGFVEAPYVILRQNPR